ncbi:hypothetical protein C8R45DRAFT_945286 [Mycena sanguinolenta]|nr:hypothetical protein C8R45DRAFT_945286 [Mycena sanguinolenta]
MPAIEISTFPLSDSATPELFKEPLEAIKGVEGHVASYYGLQTENNKIAYFVSVWSTYEQRSNLTSDPKYAGLLEKLKSAVTGPPTRHHFDFSGDYAAALSAPSVAIGVATLKDSADAAKLTTLEEDLVKAFDAASGARKPTVYGQSVEDKSKFFIISGWDSLEAHQAVIAGGSLTPLVAPILAIADFSQGHAALQKQ